MSEELVTVARLQRPQGVRGEIRAEPRTFDPTRYKLLQRVFFLSPEGGPVRELSIEKASQAGALWIFKFKGIDTPEAARELTNGFLQIHPDERLPLPEGQYYFSDLEGLKVVDDTGRERGRVIEVQEQPTVNVFRMRVDGKEVLAPWIDDAIGELDIVARTVVLHVDYIAEAYGLDP